jgi:rhodanese-related sulfurtransferase
LKIKLENHRLPSLLLTWLLMMLFSANANAEQKLTPDQIEGAVKINAEELIALAESKPDLVIIDARISDDRKQGYIEGSISLPNTKTDCDTLSKVIKTSKSPTSFYCNGTKCGRSVKSIKIALACGYKNIYWYRGGFEDWLENDLPYLVIEN